MNISDSLAFLNHVVKDYDWFHGIELDHNRFIVYANRMDAGVFKTIPESVGGRQVLVHFTNSKLATKEHYTSEMIPFSLVNEKIIDLTDEVEEIDVNLEELMQTLDRLERQCNANIIQDIFYEVHDGKNAVTNLSAKFPDVRKEMEELYDNYGFDIIYEELNG